MALPTTLSVRTEPNQLGPNDEAHEAKENPESEKLERRVYPDLQTEANETREDDLCNIHVVFLKGNVAMHLSRLAFARALQNLLQGIVHEEDDLHGEQHVENDGNHIRRILQLLFAPQDDVQNTSKEHVGSLVRFAHLVQTPHVLPPLLHDGDHGPMVEVVQVSIQQCMQDVCPRGCWQCCTSRKLSVHSTCASCGPSEARDGGWR